MKRLLLPILMVFALAACGQKADTAPVATDPAPAPAATAPEPAPAPVTPADPATDPAAPADEVPSDEAPAEGTDPATADVPAEAPEEPAPRPAPPVVDPATAPRAGVDYVVLPTPQPTFGQGGIEVAEIFSYTCIHCANLQPNLVSWKAAQPSDVRLAYVPAAWGGAVDNFGRAYFAAEAMGLLDKTHDAMFGAVLVERKFATGSPEEIADYYATQGADRGAFLSTMESFSVTAKLNRARQFAIRTGVDSTPTFIVNGKYLAQVSDRGPQGLFDTLDYLIAHERAGSTP